jgi:hypothetical protein
MMFIRAISTRLKIIFVLHDTIDMELSKQIGDLVVLMRFGLSVPLS